MLHIICSHSYLIHSAFLELAVLPPSGAVTLIYFHYRYLFICNISGDSCDQTRDLMNTRLVR